MHELLKFAGANWWWLFWVVPSVLGGAAEWISDQFDVGLAARRRKLKDKRKHELALKRIELRIAQAKAEREASAEPALEPFLGPCKHRPRDIKPVIGADEELKAWLCTACDTQLPPSWAVLEEDEK